MSQEVLEVQHGIWIDEQLIRDAGLEGRLRILIAPGEIRILSSEESTDPAESAHGWDLFRTLGDDAEPGHLKNAAEEHDRYLYGKDE